MQNAGTADPLAQDGSPARVSLFDDMFVTELGTDFEQMANSEGYALVAGVDEVGRGCLAGPVVAAAAILDLTKPLPDGLDDSKKVGDPAKREAIAAELRESCLAYAIGEIDAGEIDRINILEATKKAMLAAIGSLAPKPDFLLIDALRLKATDIPQKAIIKGDAISVSIAAASIIAKVYRDELMRTFHIEFPHYALDRNKGYGCAEHYAGLKAHGPSPIHRKTFRGVV